MRSVPLSLIVGWLVAGKSWLRYEKTHGRYIDLGDAERVDGIRHRESDQEERARSMSSPRKVIFDPYGTTSRPTTGKGREETQAYS